MDRNTKRYLNEVPWTGDSKYAVRSKSHRPRLWPWLLTWFIGVAVITASVYWSRSDSLLSLVYALTGVAWSMLWVTIVASVLNSRKAWDRAHGSRDYSRWG